MLVEVRRNVFHGKAVEPGQPVSGQLVRVRLGLAIQLGAVAGRKNDRFAHAFLLHQAAQRRDDDVGSKSDPFPDTDRGRRMVET